MLDTCEVEQVPTQITGASTSGRDGFRIVQDPSAPVACFQHIEFTEGARLLPGARAVVDCILEFGQTVSITMQ